MAIRLVTLADAPTLIGYWDQHRVGAEYAREPGLTLRWLEKALANPDYFILIDTATKTLAIAIQHDATAEVSLIFTRTTGALAAMRAVDRMFARIMQGAIARGLATGYGAYRFPAGFDWTTARAVRYFDTVTPLTRSVEVLPGGETHVRYDGDCAATLAFLQVRSP